MIIMSSDNTTIMDYHEIIICKVNIFGYNVPNGKCLLGEYNTLEEAKKVMKMLRDSIEKGEKYSVCRRKEVKLYSNEVMKWTRHILECYTGNIGEQKGIYSTANNC